MLHCWMIGKQTVAASALLVEDVSSLPKIGYRTEHIKLTVTPVSAFFLSWLLSLPRCASTLTLSRILCRISTYVYLSVSSPAKRPSRPAFPLQSLTRYILSQRHLWSALSLDMTTCATAEIHELNDAMTPSTEPYTNISARSRALWSKLSLPPLQAREGMTWELERRAPSPLRTMI